MRTYHVEASGCSHLHRLQNLGIVENVPTLLPGSGFHLPTFLTRDQTNENTKETAKHIHRPPPTPLRDPSIHASLTRPPSANAMLPPSATLLPKDSSLHREWQDMTNHITQHADTRSLCNILDMERCSPPSSTFFPRCSHDG
jgi:hypothetical protein